MDWFADEDQAGAALATLEAFIECPAPIMPAARKRDQQARKLEITRQALITMWIAERLE